MIVVVVVEEEKIVVVEVVVAKKVVAEVVVVKVEEKVVVIVVVVEIWVTTLVQRTLPIHKIKSNKKTKSCNYEHDQPVTTRVRDCDKVGPIITFRVASRNIGTCINIIFSGDLWCLDSIFSFTVYMCVFRSLRSPDRVSCFLKCSYFQTFKNKEKNTIQILLALFHSSFWQNWLKQDRLHLIKLTKIRWYLIWI